MYRLILADDEPLILAGIRQRIDWPALGFEIVAECADGDMLLSAIDHLNPDALVMDIQMPKRSGIEVMHSIHRSRPLPIIVISGYSDFSYAQAALHYGAVDYLLKPITSNALYGAAVKLKQLLDLSTTQGRQDSELLIHFFRENMSVLPETGILERLQLSGQHAFYSVVAFQQWVQPTADDSAETALLRYDARTMLLILHYDRLPVAIERYIREQVRFEGAVGISAPFEHIRQLLAAADQAALLLHSSFIKTSVFLWPTENAAQSVGYFLRKFRNALAKEDPGEAQQLLAGLPDYLVEHRLNITHFEKVFNALQFEAGLSEHGRDSQYLPWPEIICQYESIDNTILYLGSLFQGQPETSAVALASNEIIFKIRMTIQQEYANHLSLREMAERYHLDKSYLSTLFHSEVGQTFTAYLTQVRIGHACDYLKNTQLSHNEIAILCGFNNDAYLKKVFKKTMLMSPSQYRKKQQESL